MHMCKRFFLDQLNYLKVCCGESNKPILDQLAEEVVSLHSRIAWLERANENANKVIDQLERQNKVLSRFES